jgi:hypothetical protein
MQDRAEPILFRDHEVAEDFLAVLQASRRITYRDILSAIASSFASRVEGDNFWEMDTLQLASGKNGISISYVPPNHSKGAHYHEGVIQNELGDVYVFRQSPIDSKDRVRAYKFDGRRDAHDWVAISQRGRRSLIVSMLYFSFQNPPKPI